MHIKMSNKIIKVKGGLGNQLFQYAYGRYLLVKNKKVMFDLSFFQTGKNNFDTNRVFLLNDFNIINDSYFTIEHESGLKKNFIKILRKFKFNIDEFYQTPKYLNSIKSLLVREISLKNPSDRFNEAVSKIKKSSVSIHVRHGDYLNDEKTKNFHGVLDLEYYKKAYNKLKEKQKIKQVVFFSDNIEWVKKSFNFIDCEVIYVNHSKLSDTEELILMSKCSHHIIANSTFSWWGAWLNPNPNKIVIAPKQWTTKKTSDELDILPKGWVQL
jgi:hypothetical protein